MARQQIILQSFGLQNLKPAVYRANFGQGLPQNASDFPEYDIEVENRLNTGADDAEVLSYLGTPVFSDLILKLNDEDTGLNIQTVLFDVSMAKNIVKTTVQGRKGTVKEYISDGDYVVVIRGLLVDQSPYIFPSSQVQTFRDIMEQQKDIIAVSPFLQMYGIYNLVVESFRVPQVEGFQNQQVFEINAVSDEPIELIEDV